MSWTTGKATVTICLDLRVWQEEYTTFRWAQSPLIWALQQQKSSSQRALLYSILTGQKRTYTARRITSGPNVIEPFLSVIYRLSYYATTF